MAPPTFDPDQPNHESLRDLVASRTRPVLALVGSGLSQPAGLPNWPKLKSLLLATVDKTADSAGGEERSRMRALSQAAAFTPDLWNAFGHIREALGPSTFRSQIRSIFERSSSEPIPEGYGLLARLRPAGVLSLNLDRFAHRAFLPELKPTPAVFTGADAGAHAHLLKDRRPFIAQLHGTLDNEQTWVLTSSDFGSIRGRDNYSMFWNACLLGYTLVMAGISADDVAVGGFLEDLRRTGIDAGNHFWITDRSDSKTKLWAEQAGLQTIFYPAPNGDHSAFLGCLRDLAAYKIPETAPPPVTPDVVDASAPPATLEELLQLRDDNEVRERLNGMAAQKLRDISAGRLPKAAYDRFLDEFDAAIHRAWYISPKLGSNRLFQYKLEEKIARGGFGTVYRATGPDGSSCAIKVLSNEVRQNREMFESFRRGVQAMRILSEAGVTGMVPYKEASEIPACAVMDYVDGMNLRELVEAGLVADWVDVLWIADNLVRIIRNAHELPQRVLHRDIRPENVMIRNPYSPTERELVVLDFDLCWHRDAEGLSVKTHNDANGFVAPELLHRTGGVSTRSATVDSFGIGMTLYYLRTSHSPRAGDHNAATWQDRVRSAMVVNKCRTWASLPARFARVILDCTRDNQSERIDMSAIEVEIKRLQVAAANPELVESAELIAEELAARSTALRRYVWDPDTATASISLPTGMDLALKADVGSREVTLRVAWQSLGTEERSGLTKYVSSRSDQAAAKLRHAGWQLTEQVRGDGRAVIEAKASATSIRPTTGAAAKIIDQVAECFEF